MDIYLDTDPGDDIDDALALALALRSPEVMVRGITTVFLDAPRRALFIRQLLRALQPEAATMPVLAGISRPLLQKDNPPLGKQFQWLEAGEWTERGHAVDYLIEAARLDEEPDEPLTVVAIGPLTNIAVALVREPRLIQRLRLVVMGGCFFKPHAEWNIKSDPEAAAIVVESGVELSFIGLDVTQRCTLDAAQIKAIGAAQPVLAELIALWQQTARFDLTLHDPLALATLWSDAVRFEDRCVRVELCGEARGQTVLADGPPNARVAVDVDVQSAVQDFMRRMTS